VGQYFEKLHHKKRGGGMVQGVGPEFKPQYHKKKKKNCSSIILVIPVFKFTDKQTKTNFQ
jgi:hypothetical protein